MSVGSPTAGTWSSSQWRPDNEFETDRFSEASYYLWRNKFGGMTVSAAKRLKEPIAENTRLKKLLAEAVLENEVDGAPRNPALRSNAFEVADQQQAEVRPRRQTRVADRRGVERRTLAFDERVEAVRVEHLIRSVIERMPARDGQLVSRNPQPRRAGPVLASSHGHAGV